MSTDIENEITKSSVWKKGTDVNQAILHILTNKFVILNSSTVVIIVSDAKTINAANTAESLKALAGRVKQIYWLNPIPEYDWGRIAHIDSFKKKLRHAGLQQPRKTLRGMRAPLIIFLRSPPCKLLGSFLLFF
jgi:uncharacterized protein with von Willebrand factor type A (vWA) domain